MTVIVAAAVLNGCSGGAGTHTAGPSTAGTGSTTSVALRPPTGGTVVAQDPATLAPQLKPDARTLFLSRGGVPNNTVSQVEVPAAATLTMTVACSGSGQLNVMVSETEVAPIACPTAGQVVRLGKVGKGTSEFQFAGTDGLAYVARVQSDRRLS